jgi:hypothetical protein
VDAPDKALAEFFTILGFCDACGHQPAFDRARLPAEATVQ